ncbi:MAG TPA: DoxX family membrane protein [Bacillota bacterium]|nr:DoxX family membrane protein [Bacillota bacterium]
MFVNWLRTNVYASILLLLARLYIGYEWISAGYEKLSDGFSAAKFLQGAIDKPVVTHDQIVYPLYNAFLKAFALPNVGLINFIIPWAEVLVGLGLLLGCLTTVAGFFGMTMNTAFMLAGTVSSNPWMLVITIFILVAGRNAGKFGLDRYVLPYIDFWFKPTKE